MKQNPWFLCWTHQKRVRFLNKHNRWISAKELSFEPCHQDPNPFDLIHQNLLRSFWLFSFQTLLFATIFSYVSHVPPSLQICHPALANLTLGYWSPTLTRIGKFSTVLEIIILGPKSLFISKEPQGISMKAAILAYFLNTAYQIFQ